MKKTILPPPTFLTYSLGCRTNQAEIEDICRQLSTDYGLQHCKLHQQPNIVLLNTCVVTSKAEKETRQKTRELRKKYPKSFLIVMGCAITAKEKFKINLPEVDLFVSNSNKENLLNLLSLRVPMCIGTKQSQPSYNKTMRLLRLRQLADPRNDILLSSYQLSGRKFIKIQDGCDKFCSFCITCLIRGKPTSVPAQEIIKEINFWVEKGIKEIILTGINIGLYGNVIASEATYHTVHGEARQSQPNDITYLLNKILSETQIERISFSSIYPEMLTDDFLKIVVGNPRITQCFHLSLQSGSLSVLERMNRKTNLDILLGKIKRIREINPFFTLRSDIITGFPNETEEEFKETINFIQKAKVSFVHMFPYSKRKGTSAYSFADLPMQTKRERAKKILNVVEKIRKEEARSMINQLFHCLIVRDNEGITENGWPVWVKLQSYKALYQTVRGKATKQQSLKGKIVAVRITGYKNNQLLGEIMSLPTN